jgi:hypothetical protein
MKSIVVNISLVFLKMTRVVNISLVSLKETRVVNIRHTKTGLIPARWLAPTYLILTTLMKHVTRKQILNIPKHSTVLKQ